jgi:hypothetical protein
VETDWRFNLFIPRNDARGYSLNRLGTTQENGGSSWSQANGYDRYGNRWIDLGGGVQSLYFDTANNRISGWSYDASGNLLNDTVHSYAYDAEGKIKTVDSVTAYGMTAKVIVLRNWPERTRVSSTAWAVNLSPNSMDQLAT